MDWKILAPKGAFGTVEGAARGEQEVEAYPLARPGESESGLLGRSIRLVAVREISLGGREGGGDFRFPYARSFPAGRTFHRWSTGTSGSLRRLLN